MHFRDKNEMLVEIREQAMAELFADDVEGFDLASDPVDRVRAAMEAYIRFGLANANAYRMAFCTPKIDQQLSERTYRRFQSLTAAIAGAGRLRGGDPDLAARLLWSGCHGLVALCLSDSSAGEGSADGLRPAMIDGLLQGLLTL